MNCDYNGVIFELIHQVMPTSRALYVLRVRCVMHVGTLESQKSDYLLINEFIL